jgi:hypothetical protein
MGKFAFAILGGIIGSLLAIGAGLYAVHGAKEWLLADDHDRLSQLERQVEELANKPAPVVSAPEIPDDVGTRLGRLESMVLGLSEHAASSEKSQAALLVVGQLRFAVDRGDEFTVELAAVKHMLPGEDGAGLGDGTAIPRRDQLAQRFPALAHQLLDQENEARSRGFWPMIASHVQKVIRFRRMDGKGNDAEAILGRTEAAMAKDDWDQVVLEMRSLPGPYLAAAEPWLTQAEARVAADRALSRLTARALAR